MNENLEEIWKKDLTKEALHELEHKMTKEQIIERAKTLRPVIEDKSCGGMMYWVDGNTIHGTAFLWAIKKIKPTGFLQELGKVKTYHTYGHPSLVKPSVDECIYQCPFPEATAFRIMSDDRKGHPFAEYNAKLGRHECITVYYKTVIPEDILNLPIQWDRNG